MGLVAEVKNIIKSLKTNHSNEEIAQILSCDLASVQDYVKECESVETEAAGGSKSCSSESSDKSPSPDNKTKLNSFGRPRATSPQQDGLVEQLLSENASYSATDIQRILEKRLGTLTMSKRTIQRRIKQYRTHNGQGARSAEQSTPQMSAIVKESRLLWAMAHQQWSVNDWRNIFNMDDNKHDLHQETEAQEIYQDTLMGPIESPELSIVEQLMVIIGPKLEGHSPQNVEEFKSLIYDIWHTDDNIVAAINDLFASMPQRIESVIANEGGPI